MKGAHPVRFIRQAQALGFTLDEIRQLVTFDGGGGQRQCQRVHDLLSEKLRELAAREAELRALRRTLPRSLRQCEAVLGREAQAECPVVEEAAHGRHTGATVSRRSPSRRPGRGRRSA